MRRASVSLATGYSNSTEASGNVHLSPNVIARLLAVGMHQRVVGRVDATRMSAPRRYKVNHSTLAHREVPRRMGWDSFLVKLAFALRVHTIDAEQRRSNVTRSQDPFGNRPLTVFA
jgi:hypothetical protein